MPSPHEFRISIEETSALIRNSPRRGLTEEVKRELREIFDLYMDLDTHQISAGQIKEMLRVYGYHPRKEQLQRVLLQFGIRRNHEKMTYDKFEKIMEKLILQRKAAQGIMKAFELFDIHCDGCITFTSLEEVARMMGENYSDDDLHEMIIEADVNRDGVVDIHDFTALMKLTDICW